MKFLVRAVRYEGTEIFGARDIAECKRKEDAEEIVSALNATNMAELFHFGVITINEKNKDIKQE